MRVIRNYIKISRLAVAAEETRWVWVPEWAAGSSLRQVTAVDIAAREGDRALRF